MPEEKPLPLLLDIPLKLIDNVTGVPSAIRRGRERIETRNANRDLAAVQRAAIAEQLEINPLDLQSQATPESRIGIASEAGVDIGSLSPRERLKLFADPETFVSRSDLLEPLKPQVLSQGAELVDPQSGRVIAGNAPSLIQTPEGLADPETGALIEEFRRKPVSTIGKLLADRDARAEQLIEQGFPEDQARLLAEQEFTELLETVGRSRQSNVTVNAEISTGTKRDLEENIGSAGGFLTSLRALERVFDPSFLGRTRQFQMAVIEEIDKTPFRGMVSPETFETKNNFENFRAQAGGLLVSQLTRFGGKALTKTEQELFKDTIIPTLQDSPVRFLNKLRTSIRVTQLATIRQGMALRAGIRDVEEYITIGSYDNPEDLFQARYDELVSEGVSVEVAREKAFREFDGLLEVDNSPDSDEPFVPEAGSVEPLSDSSVDPLTQEREAGRITPRQFDIERARQGA